VMLPPVSLYGFRRNTPSDLLPEDEVNVHYQLRSNVHIHVKYSCHYYNNIADVSRQRSNVMRDHTNGIKNTNEYYA